MGLTSPSCSKDTLCDEGDLLPFVQAALVKERVKPISGREGDRGGWCCTCVEHV